MPRRTEGWPFHTRWVRLCEPSSIAPAHSAAERQRAWHCFALMVGNFSKPIDSAVSKSLWLCRRACALRSSFGGSRSATKRGRYRPLALCRALYGHWVSAFS
jgi:hypothetical protein